ncbi:MAG: GNAT family N-acetyltransferase [Alphaproteobacteria bacterium]|nr:GNAT family N-acetyltransferase [Alphaproteobacteria bacterium]
MIDISLPILGTNILIRELKAGDLEALYDLEVEPCVKCYLGGPVKKSRSEWIESMTRGLSNPMFVLPFIVATKDTAEFVGRAHLTKTDNDHPYPEMQVVIAKRHWGKRLGREVAALLIDAAFGELRTASVIAVVHPDNKASLDLLENLGFVQVGTNQSGGWDNGNLIFRRDRVGYAPARISD